MTYTIQSPLGEVEIMLEVGDSDVEVFYANPVTGFISSAGVMTRRYCHKGYRYDIEHTKGVFTNKKTAAIMLILWDMLKVSCSNTNDKGEKNV